MFNCGTPKIERVILVGARIVDIVTLSACATTSAFFILSEKSGLSPTFWMRRACHKYPHVTLIQCKILWLAL